MARSLILSDHYLNRESLQTVSEWIQHGFDPFSIPEMEKACHGYMELLSDENGELDMRKMREWVRLKQ